MDQDHLHFSTASRIVITVASVTVVIAGMRAANSILVPFLMAIFVAIISTPPLFWLQRKGLPMMGALLIVITAIAGIGFATAIAVGTSVDEFTRILPSYEAQLRLKLGGLSSWAQSLGLSISTEEFSKYLDPGAAVKLVTRLVNGVGNILTDTFLVSLAVIFILIETSTFPAKLRAILNNPEESIAHLDTFIANVKQYLVIKTIMSLITGAFVAICLWIIGVDFPILWGWLAFFLNFVPYVGSIIAAVPAVLLALLELGGGAVAWTAGAYIAANVVVGNIIEPRYLGKGLGLSTIVVFVSLLFWGWVLGPVGMFLSVPLTMLVKIAVESDPKTKWIGILLGAQAPEIEEEVKPSN